MINFLDKSLLFFFMSSKKFQAKTNTTGNLFLTLSFGKIGIFTPGTNFPCLSLLSSIIKSIWSFTPKKFKAVVAFAGEP